ncbi:Hypothetical protein CAP_7655 [Chondromyces apiculatus DSM 436]|uniref:Uncharacterized protein n=1 Tax=Chondromyces apiculatus DSM 436 TaxID=1192034 RepID=A0A017SYM5_9BACT|nr:Hypothetical protein CAP_7655 [Chondromyces apiculatus DSM 436]
MDVALRHPGTAAAGNGAVTMDARCSICRVNPGVIAIAADRPELLCERCAETIAGAGRVVRAAAGIVVDWATERLRRAAEARRRPVC